MKKKQIIVTLSLAIATIIANAATPHLNYNLFQMAPTGDNKKQTLNATLAVGADQFLVYNKSTNQFYVLPAGNYTLYGGQYVLSGYGWAETLFQGTYYYAIPLHNTSLYMNAGFLWNENNTNTDYSGTEYNEYGETMWQGGDTLYIKAPPIVSSVAQFNSYATSGAFNGVSEINGTYNGNFATQYQFYNSNGEFNVSPIAYDLYKMNPNSNGGVWNYTTNQNPATITAIDGYNELSSSQRAQIDSAFNSSFTSTYAALNTTQQANLNKFLQSAGEPANSSNVLNPNYVAPTNTISLKKFEENQTAEKQTTEEASYDKTMYNLQTGNYQLYYAGKLYTGAQIKNDPNLTKATLSNPTLPFNQVFSQPFVVVSQTSNGDVLVKGLVANNGVVPSLTMSDNEYLLLCVKYPALFSAKKGVPINNPIYPLLSSAKTTPAVLISSKFLQHREDIMNFNDVFSDSGWQGIQITPADVASISYSTTQKQLKSEKTTITNEATGKSIQLNDLDYVLLVTLVPEFPPLGTAATIMNPFGNNALTPAALVGSDLLFTPKQQLLNNFELAASFQTEVANVSGVTVVSDINTELEIAKFNRETPAEQQTTWNKLTAAQQYQLWNNDPEGAFFAVSNKPISTYNSSLIQPWGNDGNNVMSKSLYNFTAGPSGATIRIGTNSPPASGQGNSAGDVFINGTQAISNNSVLYLAPGTTVSIQSMISGTSINQAVYSVVEFNTPANETSTIETSGTSYNINNNTMYALPGIQWSNNTHQFSSDMPNGTSNGAQVYSTGDGYSDLISNMTLTSGSFRNDNTNQVWTAGSSAVGSLSAQPSSDINVDWNVDILYRIVGPLNGMSHLQTLDVFNGKTHGSTAVKAATFGAFMIGGADLGGGDVATSDSVDAKAASKSVKELGEVAETGEAAAETGEAAAEAGEVADEAVAGVASAGDEVISAPEAAAGSNVASDIVEDDAMSITTERDDTASVVSSNDEAPNDEADNMSVSSVGSSGEDDNLSVNTEGSNYKNDPFHSQIRKMDANAEGIYQSNTNIEQIFKDNVAAGNGTCCINSAFLQAAKASRLDLTPEELNFLAANKQTLEVPFIKFKAIDVSLNPFVKGVDKIADQVTFNKQLELLEINPASIVRLDNPMNYSDLFAEEGDGDYLVFKSSLKSPFHVEFASKNGRLFSNTNIDWEDPLDGSSIGLTKSTFSGKSSLDMLRKLDRTPKDIYSYVKVPKKVVPKLSPDELSLIKQPSGVSKLRSRQQMIDSLNSKFMKSTITGTGSAITGQ